VLCCFLSFGHEMWSFDFSVNHRIIFWLVGA
jgi:hypothetical protein